MWVEDWQWLDFANVPGVLDWTAFVLGGIGILVALVQLFRSRGALNAARRALESTRASLIKNQLVSVLPSFRETSAEIDRALPDQDREPMSLALERFSYRGSEAASLLATTEAYDDLRDEILTVVAEASAARSRLFGNPGKSVHDLTSAAADSIRELSVKISAAAVEIRNDPGRVERTNDA